MGGLFDILKLMPPKAVRKPPAKAVGVLKLGPAEDVTRSLGKSFHPPHDVTLWALSEPGDKGWISESVAPYGAKLNSLGRHFLVDVYAVPEQRWRDAREQYVIVYRGRSEGREDTERVDRMAKIIGRNLRGPAGKALRDAIDGYLDQVGKAQSQLRTISNKLEAVSVAIDNVIAVASARAVADAKKEVDNIADELADAQRQRDEISKYFQIAQQAISPSSWGSLVVAAVSCVGEAALENEIPDKSVKSLRDKLGEANRRLDAAQDAQILLNIHAATTAAVLKVDELHAAEQDFLDDRYAAVSRAETTVAEALNNAQATKAAAHAVEQRGAVVKAAMSAQALYRQYLGESDAVLASIKDLSTRYQTYKSIVAMPSSQAEPKLKEKLTETCDQNLAELKNFESWVKSYQSNAKNDLDSLADTNNVGTDTGYDSLSQILQRALVERNKK